MDAIMKVSFSSKNLKRKKFDPNDKSVNWITHKHSLKTKNIFPWAFFVVWLFPTEKLLG
jgi:hypothetical protein